MSGSAITTLAPSLPPSLPLPSSIPLPLTYYGRYLFAHSPTYSCWARLSSKDVHTALHHRPGFEGQDLWFYLNHPIRWIRIVGLVVAYDELENRYILTLDDGSGHQINLIAWKTPPPGGKPQKITPADLADVKLYSIVKAKGSVNEFWGQRQVQLKRITVLKDTNDEVAALAETTEFKRDVLLKPWVVSDEVVAEEKRKLAMGDVDEARERRKLKKQMNTARKEELAMGGENMLIDSQVEELDHEEEWRKRKARDTTEVLSPKRKKPQSSVGPVPIPDTSYRGHRRPPGLKPPPLQLPIIPHLPPELLRREREESPPIAASNFRGRRRTTPASTLNFLPPPAIPITDAPPDPLPPPPLPLESTYRGRRRAHQAEKLQLELEPGTNALGILAPTGPDHSSTFRGRRRELKLPIDVSAPPLPYPVPKYPQQPPAEPSSSSSFRGRRRIPKVPSDMAMPHITESPPVPPPISYRERWRITKAQKAAAAALSGIMLATPELSGEGISPRWAPRPLPPTDPEDLIPSMSTFVPTPPPEKVSSRHTHRADGSLRYTRYLDDGVPPSENPPQVAESSGHSSTYRGRRRV